MHYLLIHCLHDVCSALSNIVININAGNTSTQSSTSTHQRPTHQHSHHPQHINAANTSTQSSTSTHNTAKHINTANASTQPTHQPTHQHSQHINTANTSTQPTYQHSHQHQHSDTSPRQRINNRADVFSVVNFQFFSSFPISPTLNINTPHPQHINWFINSTSTHQHEPINTHIVNASTSHPSPLNSSNRVLFLTCPKIRNKD
jgi:hypothetical protein